MSFFRATLWLGLFLVIMVLFRALQSDIFVNSKEESLNEHPLILPNIPPNTPINIDAKIKQEVIFFIMTSVSL